MKIVFTCLLFVMLINDVFSDDHFHFGHVNSKRKEPFYIFTTPEVVHPGETFNVGVTMSKRFQDVIVHIKVVSWHKETVIANAEKFVPVVESDIPFVLRLKARENAKEGIAVIRIRIIQYPYHEEKRTVRIQKEKPNIFVETRKSSYNLGDRIELWVLAVDRYAMPYKGEIQSLTLKDEDGYLIDYQKNKVLEEGFASVYLSTTNVMKQGKHVIEFTINNHQTQVLLNIGKPREGGAEDALNDVNKHIFSKVFSTLPMDTPVKSTPQLISTSQMRIEIFMNKELYKVEDEAVLIVAYTKPIHGLNEFQYEVICNSQINIHARKYDLYTTFYCGFGLFQVRESFPSGPTRDELCKNRKAGFSLSFKIRKEMFPACRNSAESKSNGLQSGNAETKCKIWFLIYQVQRNGDIIANTKTFNVTKKPNSILNIKIDKYNAHEQEELGLEILNTESGRLLLIGRERMPQRFESDRAITQMNLRNFQVGGMVTNRKDFHSRCRRNLYVGAGQQFKACGIKPISNLEINYDILCNGRLFRKREIKNVIQPKRIVGKRSEAWVWTALDIKRHHKISLTTPPIGGIYYLEAILISAMKGISFANMIPVKVTQKASTRMNKISKGFKYEALKDRAKRVHDITVAIQRNLDEHLFIYRHCHPLQMEVCIRGSSNANPGDMTITIKMVHNFKFDIQDLKRVYRKRQLKFFVNLKSKAIFYVDQPKIEKSCFHVKLKQFAPYELKLNNGTVAYFSSNKKEWKTLSYWITEEDCKS